MQAQHTPARALATAARSPWLTGAAIWSIAAASGALNAWGWSVTAAGLVAVLLVTVAIAAEILGVRLAFAVDRASREPGLRFWLALPLFLGVVGFNAYSGHRALVAVDEAQRAPLERAAAERAEAEAVLAGLPAARAAAPRIPDNVPAVRVKAYEAARERELARIEAAGVEARATLARLADAPAAPAPMDSGVAWAIVVLIEALKAFGLFAVSARAAPYSIATPRPAPPAPSPNAGRDLARMRWQRA